MHQNAKDQKIQLYKSFKDFQRNIIDNQDKKPTKNRIIYKVNQHPKTEKNTPRKLMS